MSKQHQIVVVPVEYPVPSPSSISIGEALDRVKATVYPAAPLTTSVVALVVYDPSIEAAPRAAPRANTREAGPGPDSQQAQAKPESYYNSMTYLDEIRGMRESGSVGNPFVHQHISRTSLTFILPTPRGSSNTSRLKG